MWNYVRLLIFALSITFYGCVSAPVKETPSAIRGPLIDSIHAKARENASWFEVHKKSISTAQKKYRGETPPELAYALERGIYLYEDKRIVGYLRKIVDELLLKWEGPKPRLAIILKSDQGFSAYVDEYNQLFISTGLLRDVKNEDQLAAVLAHELSHVLLKHNPTLSAARNTSRALEMGGMIAVAAAAYESKRKGSKKHMKRGTDALLGFQSMGLIWSDILTPSWSRKNEREADMMGMDLLIRAGYNYEEFYKVIERIHDASKRRSERVELFSRLSSLYLQANKSKAYKKNGNQLDRMVGDLKLVLASSIVTSGLNKIASKSKSHEDRAIRIDALKNYFNAAYEGGDLPPEIRTREFNRVLRSKAAKSRLEQDLVAIEIINAVANRNVRGAKAKYQKLRRKGSYEFNSYIAAKSSVYKLKRDRKAAIRELNKMIRRGDAPAEAYLDLAMLYISVKNFRKANGVLQTGIKKIGRDYKFLPSLVLLNKRSGNIKAAENYTIKCQEYNSETRKTIAQMVLNPQRKDSYYYQCASILGYDVIAKRERAAERKRKAQRKKVKQLEKQLKSIFKIK